MSEARRRLLGGLAPATFLARHWQKEALRVNAALAGFMGPLDLPRLRRLAARDDVESRLVVRERSAWTLQHGPLRAADFRGLPATGWTLLVQGVNRHEPACDALLRHFAFEPYARLDDVMVSYAVAGGGVGPHVDNYDVFLLQGFGRRRWRYGRQDDATFRPGLPLSILRRFRSVARPRVRPRRHAVPAAWVGARRRGARTLHDVLDRLSRPRPWRPSPRFCRRIRLLMTSVLPRLQRRGMKGSRSATGCSVPSSGRTTLSFACHSTEQICGI